MLRFQKIIITGPPRSGTTALCRLLNTSLDFCIWDEAAIWHGWSHDIAYRLRATQHWPANAELLCDRPDFKIPERCTGEEFLCSMQGLCIGDKYPTYLLDYGFLRTHTDVGIIVCLRHPFSIVASQLRRQQMVDQGIADPVPWATSSCASACALAVRNTWAAIELVDEFHERVKIVRYESGKTPEVICREISDFVGIEDAEFKTDGYKITNERAWVDELDISMITPETIEVAKILGYL